MTTMTTTTTTTNDRWIPACGGTETWTRYRDGREYLYVWNPGTGSHGWLDRSDIVHPTLPAGCH